MKFCSKIFLISLIFIFGIGIFAFLSHFNPQGEIWKGIQNDQNQLIIRSNVIGPIYIDGNFTETALAYWWCNGSGTAEIPYVIENVIIDAQNETNGIRIKSTGEYFIIKDCTIINVNSSWRDIAISQVTNGILENNTCYQGIGVSFSNTINITNNKLYGNGLSLSDVSNLIITNNTVYNSAGNGIRAWYSKDNSFVKNTIFNCSQSGIDFYHTNNSYIINNTISYSGVDGIYLSYAKNNTISGNFIHDNNNTSLNLRYSGSSTIRNNTLCNNRKYGLNLRHSGNSSILDNFVYNNGFFNSVQFTGIYLSFSANTTIIGNNIFNNSYNGIELDFSENSTLKYNFIHDNQYGISVGSSNTTIFGNTIEDNAITGMFLSTNFNVIEYNNISNHYDRGIYLCDADYNRIIHNRLINNREGIYVDPESEGNIVENNIIQDRAHLDPFLTYLIITVASITMITAIYVYRRRVTPNIPPPPKGKANWISKALGYSPEFEYKILTLSEHPVKINEIKDPSLIEFYQSPFTLLSSDVITQLEEMSLSENEKIEILRGLLIFPLYERERLIENMRGVAS